MKAKIILSVFLLGLASSAMADIVIGNFEGDGFDYGSNYSDGSNLDLSAVPGPGNTVGDYSLKSVRPDGGWGGTVELYLGGTPAQAALGSVGQVTVDVTTIAEDFPGGWGSLGLLVNAGGDPGTGYVSVWDAFDWQDLVLGTTQSLTFQLPADVMANIANGSYNWWCNIGFISNAAGTESYVDEFTGETIITFQGGAVHYFDNITVVVPEPASLALLGLGSLSLIRRKR